MAEEVVIGIDRSGKEATVLVNENGYVELFRATDNPERLVISDFTKQGDIQSAGLGTQNYFATNAPYANKYTGTNKKLYKFSTNIKPNEILDISPVSLKNKHPELYTLIFGENEIRNTKAIQDNIETIKELGYKAIGNRETGSTGLLEVAQYEIIPLTTANETYNIKPIATLQTKEGFAAGKSPEAFIETSLDTPTNVVDDLITKDVLSEAIEEAFDELEGLRLAGELPGNATHGLFTRELLNVLEAKGFDMDNPENIKRLDNWALNSGFSDVKSFSDLIIADVKEPTLVQSAFPGNNFDNDLNIIRKAENLDTIFTENVNKNVIKNEIFNDRSSLDENTIEYLKKNTDTPTNVVGNEFVDNIVNANTQLVNDLPLSETVKNQFDNVVKNRAKNLATPGGVIDAVDVWEMGVLGLMITAIAYKEFDEIPTIFKRTAINMFNSMTSMYNIPPVPLEQYDLDYEFIEKVITTGEKVMPTDIIIKKVGEIAKGVGEKGLATGFGYVPTTPKNTDTMETTQKIQPGVQEEKMFEQLKPKKIKSAGGSGARIQ